MVSLKATAPLQLMHLDFTSFESTMGKMPEAKHVLVIVDHFTRYMRASHHQRQKGIYGHKLSL